MLKAVLCSFLILLLVPISQGFSQEYSDNSSTLKVSLRDYTPFVYQDSEGYTVVVGVVENNAPVAAVSNVRIHVTFYDDTSSDPIEVVQGGTTLEVIAPNSMSPYAIRSMTPNPDISEASVYLLGFDSSVQKEKGLKLYAVNAISDATFRFSGILETGGAPNVNTNVYLAFYDGFEPMRTLQVHTIELGNVTANTEVEFEFDQKINSRTVGFFLFAESDVFSSDLLDLQIPKSQILDKLVTISDVTITDLDGQKLSTLSVGSEVLVKSQILIEYPTAQESSETAFTYYVQVKQSSTDRNMPPVVEYVGQFDGKFIGDITQTPAVSWTPENDGLFFIETFVWDANNVPIAEQGPFVLRLVK